IQNGRPGNHNQNLYHQSHSTPTDLTASPSGRAQTKFGRTHLIRTSWVKLGAAVRCGGAGGPCCHGASGCQCTAALFRV
ncbi:unnamed protein product, partial [Gadus morhua 'NCC']